MLAINQFITGIMCVGIIYQPVIAQFSFHTDPTTNSFSVQTPALKQTFTRYFGADSSLAAHKNYDGALEASQSQQQPQQQSYNGLNGIDFAQRQGIQVGYQQPDNQQQFYHHQQQQQQQQQAISSDDLAAYFQQIKNQRQQIVRQQNYQSEQQQQPSTNENQQKQGLSGSLNSQQQYQEQSQQLDGTSNTLLGVAFSPSNQVSNVKFTSAGLNYNF